MVLKRGGGNGLRITTTHCVVGKDDRKMDEKGRWRGEGRWSIFMMISSDEWSQSRTLRMSLVSPRRSPATSRHFETRQNYDIPVRMQSCSGAVTFPCELFWRSCKHFQAFSDTRLSNTRYSVRLSLFLPHGKHAVLHAGRQLQCRFLLSDCHLLARLLCPLHNQQMSPKKATGVHRAVVYRESVVFPGDFPMQKPEMVHPTLSTVFIL